ncbi:reverse transcriptase domain-containing protein [Tanacetum coccineum]
MADNRIMAQMLQDVIVVPPINANNFELKQPLINLVQSNKFTDGEARDWLDKEHPRSILTWDDLVSKFINQFFTPISKDFIIRMIQPMKQAMKDYDIYCEDVLVLCDNKGAIDLIFDSAFRGVGDEEVVVGEGVVVTSSLLEMLTNSCLGGIMVSLIFLEGLEEEALVEFMIEWFEEDEDGKKNRNDGLFN